MSAELVHDLVDRAPTGQRDRIMIGDEHERLTGGQVRSGSLRLASWLLAEQVRRGDRVVVSETAGPWLAPVLFALSRIGAVAVVLGGRSPAPAVRHVLSDALPRLVIGPTDLVELSARQGIRGAGPDEVRLRARDGQEWPGPSPALSVDPVWFIYTSGSTGRPKAVVSTHGQVTFVARAIQGELGYTGSDTVYSALPMSFDYGLYQLLLTVLGGARLELGSGFTAGRMLLRRLHDTGATILPSVPSLSLTLARLLDRPGARPPRLRLLTNTGAAMPATLLATLRARIPGLTVQLMFGLTECKRATIMPPDGDLDRPGSCGRALPGTEVFVVDADGTRLPPGEEGQIVVRGPHVMAGYWRRPDLTAERFRLVDGLFPELWTGDHGHLDTAGHLYFTGRRDDVYKEHGTRVSATEVEMAATRVDGIRAACVVLPSDPTGGATLVVESALSPARVLAAMLEQLDGAKLPRACLTLPELPLTPNGKVDRGRVAALAAGGGPDA